MNTAYSPGAGPTRPLRGRHNGRVSGTIHNLKQPSAYLADHNAGSVSVEHEVTAFGVVQESKGDPMSWSGRLLHIHIAERASLAMQELDEAMLIAGRGIEGDRYFNGTGTYSPKPDAREVTLIEMEVLDAAARGDPPSPGKVVNLAPADHRRNLTTLGVPVNHLVGKRFAVGETVLRGGRLNFPCKYLERLLGQPVYVALLNRSGLNCRIEVGGTIRKGDTITPLDD